MDSSVAWCENIPSGIQCPDHCLNCSLLPSVTLYSWKTDNDSSVVQLSTEFVLITRKLFARFSGYMCLRNDKNMSLFYKALYSTLIFILLKCTIILKVISSIYVMYNYSVYNNLLNKQGLKYKDIREMRARMCFLCYTWISSNVGEYAWRK
jgi:hypothetical protein